MRNTLLRLAALGLLAPALSVPAHAQASATADPVEPSAATELASNILSSISRLDYAADRTMDAIAEYEVTLTIGTLKNPAAFSLLCNNAGAALLAVSQSLADSLGFAGKASNPECIGTNDATASSSMRFHVHHEAGQPGIFHEDPVLLPIALLSPQEEEGEEQTLSGNPSAMDVDARDDAQTQQPTPEPVRLNPVRTQISHASMSLPKSWTPDELPKPFHSDSPFGTLDITVTFADQKLVTDQTLVIKKDRVEVAELDEFAKWNESIRRAVAPTIKLGSTLYYPSSAFSGKTEDQKKAGNLLSQAYTAISDKQFTQAESLIQQAQAIDAGHELIHDRQGLLAEAQEHFDLALKEFQEELRAFPGAPIEMECIARVQRRAGRMEDAALTLQRWMVAQPDSPFPPGQLMALYHQMHRDDLAVATGDLAMTTLPDDAKRSIQFLTTYGHEQLLTGQEQQAKVTLEKLLDTTSDMEFVNDAAYFLSEHGLSLDRADNSVRSSLSQFDEGNLGKAPHLFNMDEKENISLLFASWDTLGWILFQEHKVGDAEGYIRAAWRVHQDPAVGRHLAEILLSQQKPDAALDTFKLALASIPEKDRSSADQDPDVIAIHQSIDRLEKEGHVSSIKDPNAALEQLRTLDLGPAAGRNVNEVYRLLITPSAVDGSPANQKVSQEPFDFSNVKLPADFFPPGSHAAIRLDAKLVCAKTCSLILSPL